MKSLIATLAIVTLLSGCASAPPPPSTYVAPDGASIERQERERSDLLMELDDARKKSIILCKKNECEKIFSLVQIYISSEADMKIELVTDSVIQTNSPVFVRQIGMKAIKLPRKGDSYEVTLSVFCGGRPFLTDELCIKRMVNLHKKFPLFISSSLGK